MSIDNTLKKLGMRCRGVPSFDEYINEKQSVLYREMYKDIYEDTDVQRVSLIVNEYIDKILKNPQKDYMTSYVFLDEVITIFYEPNKVMKVNGVTHRDQIHIYREIDEDNQLEVKYTLVHEIIHIMQQKLTNEYRDFDDLDDEKKVRFILMRMESDNENEFSYYNHLIYATDKPEVYAQCQNAYLKAFQTKKNYPHKSDSEILHSVLTQMRMRKGNLSLALSEVKNNDTTFDCILGVLVGSFKCLSTARSQNYFDKSILKLDVIKSLENGVRRILKQDIYFEEKCTEIMNLIYEYKPELLKHKDEIIESFSISMTHWFEESQKRLGKAISLGIEDGTQYLENNR